MKKKLILVAAPPALGKNYVSELICDKLKSVAYIDKDDLADLLHCYFSLNDEKIDMDGDFYLKNLRSAEYSTLFHLAFSALRFERFVLINAPFLKEVRDIEFMRTLKKRANECGADLVVIWVTAPIDVCYERMKTRNSNRDTIKLSRWQEYIRQTDYSTPGVLKEVNAVDDLFVLDNTSKETAIKSVSYIIGKFEE